MSKANGLFGIVGMIRFARYDKISFFSVQSYIYTFF
jgi:hypothetical protein